MPRRRRMWAFALKMIRKPLHFVQRGRILLRCGSAFALSLPSLGVSSLDLGRLFIQAALFSCRCFIIVIPGRANFLPSFRGEAKPRTPDVQLHIGNLEIPGLRFAHPRMTKWNDAVAIPPPPGTGRDRRAERWPAHRRAVRNRQRLARTCRCVRAAAHPCRSRG